MEWKTVENVKRIKKDSREIKKELETFKKILMSVLWEAEH